MLPGSDHLFVFLHIVVQLALCEALDYECYDFYGDSSLCRVNKVIRIIARLILKEANIRVLRDVVIEVDIRVLGDIRIE